jgi:hypothetical protein
MVDQLDIALVENKIIIIKTLHGDCPFGNGVVADGLYPRMQKGNPPCFIDRHGHTIYFSKVSPEQYFE